MSPKPANTSKTPKTNTKSVKLSDADLAKASGGGGSRVVRNASSTRQTRKPKR